MDPRLEQFINMPDEEMEALSSEELIKLSKEMCELVQRSPEAPLVAELVADLDKETDKLKDCLAKEKKAHHDLKIGEEKSARLRERFNAHADAYLKLMDQIDKTRGN
jgi:hypothetical protein